MYPDNKNESLQFKKRKYIIVFFKYSLKYSLFHESSFLISLKVYYNMYNIWIHSYINEYRYIWKKERKHMLKNVLLTVLDLKSSKTPTEMNSLRSSATTAHSTLGIEEACTKIYSLNSPFIPSLYSIKDCSVLRLPQIAFQGKFKTGVCLRY